MSVASTSAPLSMSKVIREEAKTLEDRWREVWPFPFLAFGSAPFWSKFLATSKYPWWQAMLKEKTCISEIKLGIKLERHIWKFDVFFFVSLETYWSGVSRSRWPRKGSTRALYLSKILRHSTWLFSEARCRGVVEKDPGPVEAFNSNDGFVYPKWIWGISSIQVPLWTRIFFNNFCHVWWFLKSSNVANKWL